MKKFMLIVILALLCSCTASTQYGACIGIADEKQPHLVYKVSTWNAVMGIIFVETIVVPIVWLNDQLYCPVGVK